jgi:hypothetical protein
MEKPYVIKRDDRFYKVIERPVLVTRLNSANPTDISEPLNSFEMPSLGMLLENGYEIVNKGGKKSRNNRKHKKKSNTKRRGRRYH